MKYPILSIILFLTASSLTGLSGQDVARERPLEWKRLVAGGQFKDLFLPMPTRSGLSSDTWGGKNVRPRDILNGIEDPAWSYWCGFPLQDDEGGYHLYTARWPEDDPRGHRGYFDSIIVHAVAEDPLGPYRYKDSIGHGHNPELYQKADGEYIVYSTHGRFYRSDRLSGPWKAGTYSFDRRERYAFKNFVNFSFAPRGDGSFLAVSRRGYIWASEDGAENWFEVSSESIYPNVPGIFEDPVMWKDDIQYHIIVNDWKGRIAYYLRSKDGFHWKTEPGEAYVPGIARYEDGTVSDWYKFERIRFLRDEFERPTHVHFAVIDSVKLEDKPNDIHNSKNIVIPMVVARRLEMLNTVLVTPSTSEIRVKILAEEGFDPRDDIDLQSLRFGDSVEVNYGRGSQVVRSETAGSDLIVVFSGKESGLTADNFAGKLLGQTSDGELLFGWSDLPGAQGKLPLLSPLSPKFEFSKGGMVAYVEIQNFGEAKSEVSDVRIFVDDIELASGTVRPLKPFGIAMVHLVCRKVLPFGTNPEVTVKVESAGLKPVVFTKQVQIPTLP